MDLAVKMFINIWVLGPPPPLPNKVCTSGSFRKNVEHPLCIGINDIGMINSWKKINSEIRIKGRCQKHPEGGG